MLHLKLIAPGTLKESYWRDAVAEYQKRLGAYARVELTELKECRLPDSPSPAEIAAALNLHESTISRAVTGKFFQCKWGVYPLRSLFTHRIHETDTDQVLLQLQELIAAEPEGAAYSDQQLAEILSQDGVQIARRTVVKYRQKLGIPTSRQRTAHPHTEHAKAQTGFVCALLVYFSPSRTKIREMHIIL